MAINSMSTVTRLMGLSSGMDTESIIQNLMKIEQLKLDKQLRTQTTLQWKQDALKSVSTEMKTFSNTFLTALGTDGMRTSSTYLTYNVSMSGSKQDSVTITPSAEAAMKNVTVNKITQLAKGASATSSSGVSGAGKTELSEGNYVALGTLDFANDLFTGTKTTQKPVQEQETVTKNGETYKVFQSKDSGNNETYYQLASDPDGAFYTMTEDGGGAVFTEATDVTSTDVAEKMVYKQIPVVNADTGFTRVSYQYTIEGDGDENGGTFTDYYWQDSEGKLYSQPDASTELTSEEMDEVTAKNGTFNTVMTTAMEDVEIADDTIEFAINGVDFSFTKTTTLAQMLSAVNNSTAGVSMTYSRLTDSFSITSKETGDSSQLVIENKRGNAFGTDSAFAIDTQGTVDRDAEGNVIKDAAGKITMNGGYQGQNAVAFINGVRVERSSNVFSIDGIKFQLNYTTGIEEQDGTGKEVFQAENAVTATFSQNVDSSVEKIKKFIDGYNTMVNKLYNLVNEKKNSAYYALTDDEKAAMTEDQVKEWETMAKSGMLRNDRDIQNVLTQLRESFYTTVEGTGLSAQDIGLRTAYGSRSGEISLNENDLRAALERDPDAVMRVFMQTSETDAFSEQGLTFRLEKILKDYTGTTQYNTLTNMDRDMNKLVNKISDMEDRLITIEERYYQKYAAMETALAQLQSQTNWISSMMG